jgi:hypothetical protein
LSLTGIGGGATVTTPLSMIVATLVSAK